mmetsp:Transcript_88667/g.231427  ORF Transcript_88667/g.231427 Transcript_88667/m.231427 type:complete len:229 (+) Transcript_88667:106-792(+)
MGAFGSPGISTATAAAMPGSSVRSKARNQHMRGRRGNDSLASPAWMSSSHRASRSATGKRPTKQGTRYLQLNIATRSSNSSPNAAASPGQANGTRLLSVKAEAWYPSRGGHSAKKRVPRTSTKSKSKSQNASSSCSFSSSSHKSTRHIAAKKFIPCVYVAPMSALAASPLSHSAVKSTFSNTSSIAGLLASFGKNSSGRAPNVLGMSTWICLAVSEGTSLLASSKSFS